jgi:hypothetical protein|tara:strand:- start:28 stop:747 length:720 start_codon:yes stop_codon:yes gene_type:complete
MQKSKLDKFISKYNLGGNVNSVKWKSSGDSLSTSFVTPDKSLLGNVKVEKFQFEDAELGVYQTDQLKSLINVLGDDVSLNLTRFGDKAVSLKVKNGPVSVDYVLSDLSVISDPPQMKRLPEFGTKIKLDSNFISTFIKGKGALSDIDTFAVVKTDSGCDVVIGYSSTNTNRVNIPTECDTCDIDKPITFNANLFKEVLVANRECSSAILEVSTEGLARVNFKVDDFDSTYYVVAMQDVD